MVLPDTARPDLTNPALFHFIPPENSPLGIREIQGVIFFDNSYYLCYNYIREMERDKVDLSKIYK